MTLGGQKRQKKELMTARQRSIHDGGEMAQLVSIQGERSVHDPGPLPLKNAYRSKEAREGSDRRSAQEETFASQEAKGEELL